MGNSNPLKESDNRYKEIRIQQNELLSHLIIVEQKNTKERLMIKQLNIGNEIEYNKTLKQMRHRKLLSEKKVGRYLIQVKDVETKQFNEICGKNYKILLYLQYLETSLKSIFLERMNICKPFTQDEILNIIKSIVNNLIILHDNNFKNIHLYKQTIFLTEQNSFKIIDAQLSNKIHPYYQIFNVVPTKKGTYLAPELLNQLRKQNSDFYQSPKADIFTLALIALQLCTFQNYDKFYNYEKKTVNIAGIKEVTGQINYSPYLKNILKKMLAEEEQERVGLITLKQILKDVSSNDHNSNEESCTFKSISERNKAKRTARTFISRSKPDSKVSKGSSLNKLNSQFPAELNIQKQSKAYRPLSQYSYKKQAFSNEKLEDSSSKRSYQTNQPIFKPIQPLIIYQHQKTCPAYQIRQTPKSVPFNLNSNLANRLDMHKFDTPVNLLNQPYRIEPDSTPIHKIEILNTARQNPNLIRTGVFHDKTYGKHHFSNGARYEGQFNNSNQFDGNGMLYYPDGKLCYSGSWKSNSFHGFGVLHNQNPIDNQRQTNYHNFNYNDQNNWKYYEGQFDDDKKQGFGTLYMQNGDKFSGCFKQDTIEGFGTFYLARQNRYINGIWVSNELKK